MSIYSDRELSLMNELENGDLFEFKEWPNDAIPTVAAGLYAIWEGQDFIYIGMSGRGMSSTEIEAPDEPKKPKGLFNRLKSHWDGRRSGDQFCVYVCDRLVVPVLTPEQQRLIGETNCHLTLSPKSTSADTSPIATPRRPTAAKHLRWKPRFRNTHCPQARSHF